MTVVWEAFQTHYWSYMVEGALCGPFGLQIRVKLWPISLNYMLTYACRHQFNKILEISSNLCTTVHFVQDPTCNDGSTKKTSMIIMFSFAFLECYHNGYFVQMTAQMILSQLISIWLLFLKIKHYSMFHWLHNGYLFAN